MGTIADFGKHDMTAFNHNHNQINVCLRSKEGTPKV